MGQRVQTPTDSGLGRFLILSKTLPILGEATLILWSGILWASTRQKERVSRLRAGSVPWCVSCNKVSEVLRSLVAAHLIEAIQLLLGWSEALVKVFSILHLLIRVQ